MTDPGLIALLDEMRSLQSKLDLMRADMAAMRIEQRAAQVTAQATVQTERPRIEPYTVAEFATHIRRAPRYVSTRCRLRVIDTLPGKPYLIPVSELERYLANTPTSPRRNAR